MTTNPCRFCNKEVCDSGQCDHAASKMTSDDWISVDERLAGVGVPVVVLDRYKRAKEGFISVLNHNWYMFGPSGLVEATVTHWHPLPDGPEEEKV